MTTPSRATLALLPIRIFFGVTFLWAGLDKLLDPTFFDPTAPTSLHAQLTVFARQSPLGDLIRATLPLATPIGVAIAVGELGIGVGALTGIAFRVAALGGAALSLLFFLTASWPTHPYYFGADLPYLAGWIALAIAGHGNVLVPVRVRDDRPAAAAPSPPRPDGFTRSRRIASKGPARLGPGSVAGRRAFQPSAAPSPERRVLLQTGLLAAIAAILASFTPMLRAMGVSSEPTAAPPTPGPTPTPVPSGGRTPSPAPSGNGTASLRIGTVADVRAAGSLAFTVPFDAPTPLPAGDPGLVVRLADQSFVAYDAVCTHAGCTVEYDQTDRVIFCPCHGAEFDPARDAAVIAGPTRQPLAKLPLVVDPATGTISLSTS